MASIDSNGVLKAQSNYLTSIQNGQTIPTNVSGASSAQDMLNNIYNNYDQSNKYSAQVLTNQKQMSDIVNTELKRLQEKKQSIDSALTSRERVAELNDSYRLRFIEYTKMVATFVFAIFLFIGFRMAGKYLPIIPSIVIDILYVFLFCGTVIILYKQFSDIQSRDVLYFDRLNLNGPNMKSAAQIAKDQKAAGLSGNLLGSINLGACVGETCCSDGTYWDTNNSVCAPGIAPSSGSKGSSSGSKGKTNETFSSLAASLYTNGITVPSANSPYEFTDYTRV
uniref:Uncharacterized protein n=1 Tax=viral metagenome TaxID=1070528 RepID=A0A6C0D5A3_9ZZZZ